VKNYRLSHDSLILCRTFAYKFYNSDVTIDYAASTSSQAMTEISLKNDSYDFAVADSSDVTVCSFSIENVGDCLKYLGDHNTI
jgi:hypothetical protein